uniref:Elongation factor G n=1 Tax=Methylocapsa acidiphila TaxID=133552 RepID=Q2VNG4_METAI|nr:probable elongation factor g, ef-G1 [Methylocapsa acidiphila]
MQEPRSRRLRWRKEGVIMTGSCPKAAAGPRSIALVGPYGSGKSTLFEALLAAAGAPLKRSSNARNRTMSTELRLGHCTYLGDRWSILDCPGSVEFAYDASCALTAADLAVVVCEPTVERASLLPVILRTLEESGIPHFIFVNKIDALATSVHEMLAALQAHSKRPLLLRQIPIREGDSVTGFVDVVAERAYRYRPKQASELIELPPDMREPEKEALAGIAETLADQDDELMEQILEDIAPTPAELYQHLRKDQAKDSIVEVLFGAAAQGHGVARLWKALRHDAPGPRVAAARHGIAEGDEPLLQIFKTVSSRQARLWTNLARRAPRRRHIRRRPRRRNFPLRQRRGGPNARSRSRRTRRARTAGRRLDGNGARSGGPRGGLPFPAPPPPLYALAIAAKDRKDDVKLSGALHKLVEEDPSLTLEHNLETGETLLKGRGEIHLNVALERLAAFYNLQVAVSSPKVAYKETIKSAVTQHGRLKRQTGGHGQFADVKLEIEPRPRGAGFLFTDKIVGGAVPKQYIPAVREAAEEAMQKGPFGYPVVDVGVTLVDGSFHTVDSSEMAFKTATRIAIGEALAKADPVLLEPIEHVTASVPNVFTAATQRLLSGRRGQILGYMERPGWAGWDEVEALAPASELHDLIIELRSDTMGLGSFRRRFDHLAEARGAAPERTMR